MREEDGCTRDNSQPNLSNNGLCATIMLFPHIKAHST